MDDPFDGIVGRTDTETLDQDDAAKARELVEQHGDAAAMVALQKENWHRTHGGYLQAMMWVGVGKAIRMVSGQAKNSR